MTRPLVVFGGDGYIGSRVVALATTGAVPPVVVVSRANFDAAVARLHAARDEFPTVVWLLAGNGDGEDACLRQLLSRAPAGMRLVYASSCAVYGSNCEPAGEDAALRPYGAYAEAKARCEDIVAASDAEHCILRLGTVHGVNGGREAKQSVHRLLDQAAHGVVTLYGASNWRPFVGLDTVARVLLRAAGSQLTGRYNIAREHATFGAVGRRAASLFGARIAADGRHEPRSYRVDTTAARARGFLRDDEDEDLSTSMARYAKALPVRAAG